MLSISLAFSRNFKEITKNSSDNFLNALHFQKKPKKRKQIWLVSNYRILISFFKFRNASLGSLNQITTDRIWNVNISFCQHKTYCAPFSLNAIKFLRSERISSCRKNIYECRCEFFLLQRRSTLRNFHFYSPPTNCRRKIPPWTMNRYITARRWLAGSYRIELVVNVRPGYSLRNSYNMTNYYTDSLRCRHLVITIELCHSSQVIECAIT